MYSVHHLFGNCNRKSEISLDFFCISPVFPGHCMGNILFSIGGLVLFHKTLINPCTLSVEDVFPLHVYPFSPFFRVPTRNSRRFAWILPLLLFSGFFRQTYCNSRENRVYYRQRLRKAIVFRVWIREMPVGARHTCGSSRRDNVSTFQAAGEESEGRALYRTDERSHIL